jgi:hypothetical protein
MLQINNLLQKPEAVRIYRLPEQSSWEYFQLFRSLSPCNNFYNNNN